MKKYPLTLVFLLLMLVGYSQSKPAKKEKPPTAKEMEEMQKEMRAFVTFVQREVLHRPPEDQSKFKTALVRVPTPVLIRAKKSSER